MPAGDLRHSLQSTILTVYLLDTNHSSRIIERDPTVLSRFSSLDDAYVSTSIIVRGELIYMAR